MAQGNSRRRPAGCSQGSIEEHLAPLAAAAPEPSAGRIRSLEEARSALRIPTSSEPEVLKLWGVPADFELVVYPVSEPNAPDLLAEFAVLRVITRQGRQLVAREKRTRRLRLGEMNNAFWVVYGSIVEAADNKFVIESLAIGPAFNDQLGREGDDDAHGITTQLLRLLSPPRLLSASVEQLQRNGYWLEEFARRGAPPMSDKQRDLLARIEQGRLRHTHLTDDQLADIAKRYLVLYQRGLRHPLPQLAREFGITRSQARDRVHKARQHGYLTSGKQGRAGASIGPRLKHLGWNLPQPNPNANTTTHKTERQPRHEH